MLPSRQPRPHFKMKTCLTFVALFVASGFCEKQTEVVTRTSGYIVEEKIISDAKGEREEHRSTITDAQGQVTEHVVIKIFSKRLMISYSSNDSVCIVAPLAHRDAPLPAAVFDDVVGTKPAHASAGRVVDEGVVEYRAVDGGPHDIPPEAAAECGHRTPQLIRPTTFTDAHGRRLKRSWAPAGPSAPGSCGQELRYQTKCSSKTTSTCCKQCHSTVPYCFKDYFFQDVACTGNPGYGGAAAGYGSTNNAATPGYGGVGGAAGGGYGGSGTAAVGGYGAAGHAGGSDPSYK